MNPHLTPPRPYLLREANYRQMLEYRPNVAVLPWGATEAHNYHLPYATDVIEATGIAEDSAARAYEQGGRPIVLPTVPFGNDAQQLDQVATIHLSTATAASLLNDVASSLARQGIERLVILNGHGGNEFKPLVRDVQLASGLFIAVINFFQLVPERVADIFDEPGDHAGELETSLVMHLAPELVQFDQAGDGRRVPFHVSSLAAPGVWTPRPWSRTHPDTGCGDPSRATADKGERYLAALIEAVSRVLIDLSKASELP